LSISLKEEEIEIETLGMAVALRFVTETVWAALVLPAIAANESVLGLTESTDTDPIPLSETGCGFTPLSVTVRFPTACPVARGLKLT
jgi:hypothetical protein